MSLSLANMLTRVKYVVPSVTMDTELGDAILERMNYLVALDAFPFQEGYQSVSLAAGNYNMATPDNFAYVKTLVIWTAGSDHVIEKMDSTEFDKRFPNPSEGTADKPRFFCIKVAESEVWFDCPTDQTYVFRMHFLKIPDDATDTTVSQLVELAKLTIDRWACADGFRMLQEYDRADKMEEEGNRFFKALEKRYQLSREEDFRVISFKEAKLGYRGH
jgi:hypothetical protein